MQRDTPLISQLTPLIAQTIAKGAVWVFLLLLMAALLTHSTYRSGDPYFAIAAEVTHAHFDYVGWELETIGIKLGQAFSGSHAYLSESERTSFVRHYMDDLARVQQLAGEIEALYTDPNVPDPLTASASLRTERDTLRASLRQRQTTAEAILEGQVAQVLVDEGFGLGGQLLPPMAMRFTGRTLLLVTSPRDGIEMEHAMTLEPIPVDQREAIEADILTDHDLSAVIVPIGGMALYPAMIIESTNLVYLTDTFAHEWLHHYLMFHPLGIEAELGQLPETRIINETTASLFGRAIGRKVMERYYPDLLPPPPVDTPPPANISPPPDTPPPFDFNAAMHETRTTVDDLLAAGEIEAAEAYMAERRILFWDNGYRIRKLNQAWFAFYGGYQVDGISAGGEDPIGPAVQHMLDTSASLHDWIQTMQTITTREALLAAADDAL